MAVNSPESSQKLT